jgi:hypothetical protein
LWESVPSWYQQRQEAKTMKQFLCQKKKELLCGEDGFDSKQFLCKQNYCDNGLHSWTDASAPKKKSQVQAKHQDLTANASNNAYFTK